MRGILSVELAYHWGFWARPPIFSARQPTMTVPPPTTLVGALARGLVNLARAEGRHVPEWARKDGEYVVPLAAELSRGIEAVYYRVISGVVTALVDKNRVFQAPYVREGNVLEDPSQMFAVRDLGKAYAPGVRAEAAFLIDLEVVKGLGGPQRLIAAAHSITRIGPAEGVVAVTKAELTPLDECREGVNDREPCPYFPLKEDMELPTPWARAEFLDWRDERTWTSMRNSAGKVAYAVPSSSWAAAQPEFPWCATLKRRLKFIICNGRTYPA